MWWLFCLYDCSAYVSQRSQLPSSTYCNNVCLTQVRMCFYEFFLTNFRDLANSDTCTAELQIVIATVSTELKRYHDQPNDDTLNKAFDSVLDWMRNVTESPGTLSPTEVDLVYSLWTKLLSVPVQLLPLAFMYEMADNLVCLQHINEADMFGCLHAFVTK